MRTRAELDFPEPLPLEMEAWNIPTNLIHDPLIGFAAVRGIRPWLKSFKLWQEPNQEACRRDAHATTPPTQTSDFGFRTSDFPWALRPTRLSSGRKAGSPSAFSGGPLGGCQQPGLQAE